MAERMLYRLYRDQVQAVQGTVEAWQAEHSSAMAARDVEDIVRASRHFAGSAEQMLSDTFDDIERGRIDDLDEAGRSLRAAFEQALELLVTARRLAQGRADVGYPIEGLAELDSAIARFRP